MSDAQLQAIKYVIKMTPSLNVECLNSIKVLKALKFIEKQDKIQRLRIYKAIYNLPNGDVKKLAG